jgi:hypothetical protein
MHFRALLIHLLLCKMFLLQTLSSKLVHAHVGASVRRMDGMQYFSFLEMPIFKFKRIIINSCLDGCLQNLILL